MMNLLRFAALFLVLCTVTIFAQKPLEMSVVPESAKEEPSELISKEIRDANGEVCAGLIVYSDLKGLTYQSYNGVVKVNSNAGKDFLFLSPDERVVEVYCFGYTPLKIILNELGIKLKSGQSWSLKVTGEKKLELIPVNILVTPDDARISIDGVEKGSQKSHQLSAGKHAVRIERSGYTTITDSIDVSLTNSLFHFTLPELDMIPVTINSVPTGAKIFVDEVDKGETNKGLFLYPNRYRIRLSKSGYGDTSAVITVTEKGKNDFTFTLAKNTGTLSVSIQPSDAQLLVNKENMTGKNDIELTPGTYKIEIAKEDYYPFSEVIVIQKNKTVQRSYQLKPKVGAYQFSVTPLNANAQLSRNGTAVKQWSGLTQFKDLQVGTYQLNVTLQGYEPVSKTVTVRENETVVEDITLAKAVYGSLRISAQPAGASIVLAKDGKTLRSIQSGTTVANLAPGSYSVQVSSPGYETVNRTVIVKEGLLLTEEVTLDQIVYTEPMDKDQFYLSVMYGIDSSPKGGNTLSLGWYVHVDMMDKIFYGELSGEYFTDKLRYDYPSTPGTYVEQSWSGLQFDAAVAVSFAEGSFIEPFFGYHFRLAMEGTQKTNVSGTDVEQELDMDNGNSFVARMMYGVNLFPTESVMLKIGLFSEGTHFEDSSYPVSFLTESRSGFFSRLSISF